MKKRSFALFLAIALLLSLLVLSGCKKQEADNNGENTQSQPQNSNEEDQTQAPGLPKELLTLETCSEEQMLKYRAIYEETGYNPVVDASNYSEEEKVYTGVVINYFYATGFGDYRILTHEEYENIQKYQNETGKQVIYPTVKYTLRDGNSNDDTVAKRDVNNANIYYLTKISGSKTIAVLDPKGDIVPNYWKLAEDETAYLAAPYNSLRIEGENGFEEDGKQYRYVYGRKTTYGIEARVFLYEYYQYLKATQPGYTVSEEDFFALYKLDILTQTP